MEAVYQFSGVLWEYSEEALWVFKASGSYSLPIKRGVRDEENLVVGDVASVILRIDLD
jgi:hypothetical protein